MRQTFPSKVTTPITMSYSTPKDNQIQSLRHFEQHSNANIKGKTKLNTWLHIHTIVTTPARWW
jgi:hypothetical protein